ncbi:MAG: HDOD domain-containing protein, partial [bacterium]
LPALPIIASKLLDAVDDPDTSAAELAELISSDPALATRLLKLANSAYYGFPRRIGTVNLAVVVLGFETVRDLCLSVIIADCFFHTDDELPLNMEQFWRHSLYTAIASRLIYKMAGAHQLGEGFIAGLVHDIGKLFFARYFPSEGIQIIEEVQNNGTPLLQAEQKILKVTHPVAGAWLLEEWNFPEWLVEATRNHHIDSGNEEAQRLPLSIQFGDYMVRQTFDHGSQYGVDFELSPALIKSLKLYCDENDKVDIAMYAEKINEELEKSSGFLDTFKESSL